MIKLKKYKLENKKALAYLNTHLKELNSLSELILLNNSFSKGEFFTFLRSDISTEQLYSFKYGGVGKNAKQKVIDLVHKELKGCDTGVCIFDDFNEDYEPDETWDLYNKAGVHLLKEVYFAVEPKNSSKELLLDCFRASDCTWHSLAVLSKSPFSKKKDKSITEDDLKKITTTADYIFIGAYDAEGYIIWKRNSIT